VSGEISIVGWVIPTVGKHVIAQQALSSCSEGIRINESAPFGVIVAGLEVVQLGLSVVDIATVAEGVIFTQGASTASGGGENVAPGIVGISYQLITALVNDTDNVALEIRHIVVTGTVIDDGNGDTGRVVVEVHFLIGHGHLDQLAVQVLVLVSGGAVGSACAQTVRVVGGISLNLALL